MNTAINLLSHLQEPSSHTGHTLKDENGLFQLHISKCIRNSVRGGIGADMSTFTCDGGVMLLIQPCCLRYVGPVEMDDAIASGVG